MNEEHPDTGPDEADLSPGEARAAAALRDAPRPRLDDLTRRRLVRRAMEAGAGRGRRWQWVAAAAVVVALVAAAGALLLGPGGGEDTTAQIETDDEKTTGEPTDDEADVEPEPIAAQSAEDGAPLHLGELGSEAELVAALDRLGAGPDLAVEQREAEAQLIGLRNLAPGCADALEPDFLIALYALATFRGVEVVVVGVGTDQGNALAAYVFEAATCTPLDGWDPRRL